MAGDQSDLVAERLAASNSKLSVTASGDIQAVDAVAPSRSPVRPALQTAWEIAWRRSQPHMMYQTIRSAASHMGTSVRDSGPKNFWDRPEFEFRP